jgi:hypothetical protein
MTDIPELISQQLARSIPARVRKRLMLGQFDSGEDVAALRRFVGLTQAQFAGRWASAFTRCAIGSKVDAIQMAPPSRCCGLQLRVPEILT